MGKFSKKRLCPALGKEIAPAECGAGRHSRINCPESCEFNPFSAANYDQFRVIEGSADEVLMRRLVQTASNRGQFELQLEKVMGDGPNEDYYLFLAWHAYFRPDSEGNTFLGQWAKAGFASLKNDEQVHLRGRLQMQVAILEAQRILDDRRVEMVDLLDSQPQPFIVVDRSLSSMSVRFGQYACFIYRQPHFARIFGICVPLPDHSPFTTQETVEEIIRHLGGPSDRSGQRRWLAEHFKRFHEATGAVSAARWQATLDNLDTHWSKTIYALNRPFAECLTALDAAPRAQPDRLSDKEMEEGLVDARAWLESDGVDMLGSQFTLLGRVLLGNTEWRLETMTAGRMEKLRERFEAALGDRVRFVREERDDVGSRLKLKRPPFDAALVPPKLLEQPNRLALTTGRVPIQGTDAKPMTKVDFVRSMDERFLSEPVPALSNKTPREAAFDPQLRPKLLQLMKQRIRSVDEDNLESGRTDDINWMVRELGLTEILFDPPPPRAPLATNPNVVRQDDLDELADLPPPPPLPPHPWSMAEAMRRMEQAMSAFPSIMEAVDYFDRLGYLLFDDLEKIMGDLIDPAARPYLEAMVALVVLCFAPRGTEPPDVWPDDLRKSFDHAIQELAELPGKVHHWTNSSRQPELLKGAFGLAATRFSDDPHKDEAATAKNIAMLLALKVVVDELDKAMRER